MSVRLSFLKKIPIEVEPASSFRRPDYTDSTGIVESLSHLAPAGQLQWYPPVMMGADTVRSQLFSGSYIDRAIDLMCRLSPDDYTSFLINFFSDGRARFGREWCYADIVTVLLCLSGLIKPRKYLEIGVRRGRSAAAVAA